MTPDDISFVRHGLPDSTPFPFFAGRDSAWLLANGLTSPCSVRDVRRTRLGKLLDRPVIKPMIAASSDGVVRPEVFTPLADVDLMPSRPSKPFMAGAEAALAERWFDFTLTFDAWGHDHKDWGWSQLSRKGGNLVLQLGFPSDHAVLMGSTVRRNMRRDCEFSLHPVRESGCPTLAWVRLDIDMSTGDALIEEVQSDWLRYLADEVNHLRKTAPRSRDLRSMERYQSALLAAYARIWPRAAVLAALDLVVRELQCRTIWMHMPKTGAVLKHITGTKPPRSLYTGLPKAFCFEPTRDAPHFLERKRRRALSLLRKDGDIFWRISL
ncbi:MAG: hypothetical protein AAGK71_00830 [Pseudomonadota bacterium]